MFAGRLARPRSRGRSPADPLALASVELTDVERAVPADEDTARSEVVGPEVDEGADCVRLADRRRDDGSLRPFWSETTKPSGAS